VPLRIACDLDGTIADMDAGLQRQAEAMFGPDVDITAGSILPLAPLQSPAAFGNSEPPSDSPDEPPIPATPPEEASSRRPLTSRERRALWERVGATENFWAGLQEIEPGLVARFAALAEQHRWEVLFVTQRPAGAGATPQLQSQQWLRAHGWELPSVYVMQGSRGKLADALALDAVVDDRPDNCLDVVTDSTARAILVWRRDPQTIPPGASRMGITLTYRFSDALDELEKLMVARQRKGGLLGRIRDAIGL
jgi:hypothetical protein